MVWNINYRKINNTFDGIQLSVPEGTNEEESWVNLINELFKEKDRLRIAEITEAFPD